jgi:hypothetical protein
MGEVKEGTASRGWENGRNLIFLTLAMIFSLEGSIALNKYTLE